MSAFVQCPKSFCAGRLLPVQVGNPPSAYNTFNILWGCSSCGYKVGANTEPYKPQPKPAIPSCSV